MASIAMPPDSHLSFLESDKICYPSRVSDASGSRRQPRGDHDNDEKRRRTEQFHRQAKLRRKTRFNPNEHCDFPRFTGENDLSQPE